MLILWSYLRIYADKNQLRKHESVLEIKYQRKTVGQYIAKDMSRNWQHDCLLPYRTII